MLIGMPKSRRAGVSKRVAMVLFAGGLLVLGMMPANADPTETPVVGAGGSAAGGSPNTTCTATDEMVVTEYGADISPIQTTGAIQAFADSLCGDSSVLSAASVDIHVKVNGTEVYYRNCGTFSLSCSTVNPSEIEFSGFAGNVIEVVSHQYWTLAAGSYFFRDPTNCSLLAANKVLCTAVAIAVL